MGRKEAVKQIVFGVGFALLLPLKLGLDGVLCSMPLSDILTFLIAVFLICQTYKELSGITAKSMEKRKDIQAEASGDEGEGC